MHLRGSSLAAALLAVSLASCSQSSIPEVDNTLDEVPLYGADSPNAIPDQYIVVFKKSPENELLVQRMAAGDTLRTMGLTTQAASVQRVYTSALLGFAGNLQAQALNDLRNDARVAYIEQDSEFKISATQNSATWGLDRIDQRALPLSGSYTYNTSASGVHAYIIDTGIRATHNEFSGRMGAGYDAVTSGGNANDCNGHGTHVAGTVGGTTYGVAKGVTLHAVRVLGCNGSGSNSGVIAGIDWVKNNHIKPAVANMSLGGSASTATDDAVRNAVNAGVTMVVAAGNDNADACGYSPARAASAITVGATTNTDARSSFSNFGTCLDVFAPGSSIVSADYGSNTGTSTKSGTSMASPHVAGVAALYLAANTTATPSQVRDAIVSTGSNGRVTSVGTGSPNVLAYSILSGSDGTPTPPAGTTYTGSISTSGSSSYQPSTSGLSYTAGSVKGTLTGPSGTDFDLLLQKKSGSTWSTVARSEGSTSSESVTYNADAGTYRWRVYAYSGTGSYTLVVEK
jgi:aqualysin 1